MIHVATDASYDDPICSCGYVVTESENGVESLVDSGFRILNTDTFHAEIPWCGNRAEFRAVITGVRAAVEYTTDSLLIHTDSNVIVEHIRKDYDTFEDYFYHAFRSFVYRFDDWYILEVDRARNEVAHEQARAGLKTARRLLSEVNEVEA